MSSDQDGFISRWSRRKAETSDAGGLRKRPDAVVAEAPEEPVRGRMITEPLPVPSPETAHAALVEQDDAGVDANAPGTQLEPAGVAVAETERTEDQDLDIEELESIDIEAMDFDADFTKFMQPGVPERLRQRALRRLWGTNPILANVDGLNDYDEDYTDAALAVDVLKSAWKVGQGYLTDEEVEARDAERLGTSDDGHEEADAEIATARDAEETESNVEAEEPPVAANEGPGDEQPAIEPEATAMSESAPLKTS